LVKFVMSVSEPSDRRSRYMPRQCSSATIRGPRFRVTLRREVAEIPCADFSAPRVALRALAAKSRKGSVIAVGLCGDSSGKCNCFLSRHLSINALVVRIRFNLDRRGLGRRRIVYRLLGARGLIGSNPVFNDPHEGLARVLAVILIDRGLIPRGRARAL